MNKYIISKRGSDCDGYYYDQPIYHNDTQVTYASPTSSYYVLINRKTKKELPSCFDTKKAAKKHASKLEKKK